MLNPETATNNPFALETNITSIQNLNTYIDHEKYKYHYSYCYFKKTKNNPLIYYCVCVNSYCNPIRGQSYNEIIIDDVHDKFRFRIQPYNITTEFSISGRGGSIYFSDPEELDLVKQSSINFQFIISDNFFIHNLALIYSGQKPNANISTLNCILLNYTQKCKISISHFIRQNYKENGLAYLYYSYGSDSLKISYMIPPIKVTLPKKIIVINIGNKKNLEKKVLCKNARLYIITDYYDSNNIFDSSDIEEKTLFRTTITIIAGKKPKIYDISCRLWKPKNRNLIIICQVDNGNIEGESSFQGFFNESSVNYNDYRVIITPDIILDFLLKNNTCPFLYSDEHIINVDGNNEYYELNFKIDSYNNEPLFLSNTILNYLNLQCSIKEKDMICKLEKNKLLEQNNE